MYIELHLEGLEDLEKTVQEADEIAEKLEDVVRRIRPMLHHLRAKANQPPAATDG